MCTTQMLRPLSEEKQFTDSWVTIFPNEQATYQQSLLFIKKLLAVAISNITYMRAIFPEYAFGDRCLEEIHLKILREDNGCPGACQVVQWVRGCFDAIEKKYLKQLILGVYTDPEKDDTLIESFAFRFSYENDANMEIYRNDKHVASAHSTVETRRATVSLLRTLVILMQNLQPLPDDVMLTMKLLYYEAVTPPDYEPKGFKPAKSHTFDYAIIPANIKIGDVSTKFHSMNVRMKTDCTQFKMDDDNDGEPAVALEDPTIDLSPIATAMQEERLVNSGKWPDTLSKESELVDLTNLSQQRSLPMEGKSCVVKSCKKKVKNKQPTKKGPGTEPSAVAPQDRCAVKRTRPLNNENFSFELDQVNPSQEDALDSSGLRRSKRLKSSTVNMPLLV